MSEMNETANSDTQETPTPSLLSEEAATVETTTEAAVETTEEAEAVEEVAPLTSEDLVLPEGFTADPEITEDFLKVLNDKELTGKDRASALIELQTKLMTKASEAGSAAWDNMQTEWRDAVKSDPVIGGEKMAPALASVSKLVTEYGTPELMSVFDLTGAGNNVHVIKFLHNLAGKLTEGEFTQGRPAAAAADTAALLYPSMKG